MGNGFAADPADESWREECDRMVREQIAARGILDGRVLAAMRAVPRHLFVPAELREHAYADGALPIREGQTISQPYIVAVMSEALRLRQQDRVLEIGTGSGYQAALLARLADRICSIERVPSLARRAQRALDLLGPPHPSLVVGDGLEAIAPDVRFDALIVTAAAPAVAHRIRARLADGGRLVIPVGSRELQTLLLVERRGDRFREASLGSCVFVPLLGQSGWQG